MRSVWNSLIVPNVRFVHVNEDAVRDPRVQEIRALHAPDEPTARLTALLAPAVLATDNRKHFGPFGIPDVKTDDVAIDLFALGQFGTGTRGAMLVPTVTGTVVIDGSKKIIENLGTDTAILIGVLILGGIVLFLMSDRGRDLRKSLTAVGREVGPPLAELVVRTKAASERVGAFAVEPVVTSSAQGRIAVSWLSESR